MAKSRAHGPNMSLPICKLQIACDGSVVKAGSTTCYRCREKQAKKNRPPPPLRGENTCVSGAERKEYARLREEE